MRPLYVAIGVDCDPDRASYPASLTWRGVEALPRLFDIDGVRWTLNIRADTQVRDYCGSAGYCRERYDRIWQAAELSGSSLAWHLHYFDAEGRQDTAEANILENIRVGREALGGLEVVHMGWTFQNEFSIRHLYDAGVRVDYSLTPRMRFGGRGVDAYDWSAFAYRPTTTAPILYRRLLNDFFKTGSDFFVSYFHSDELVPALGDWRDRLYAMQHLRANLRQLSEQAERNGYRVQYVNMAELSRVLFDDRSRSASACERRSS